MSEYSCPSCHSSLVFVRWPHLECHKCGASASLIDFPCSPDYQAHYARHYGGISMDGQPAPELRQGIGPSPARASSELTQLRALMIDVKGRIDLHILRSKRKKGEY